MAGNVNPQYTKQGNFGSVLITAANTSSAGGGTVATDIFKAFTADATNGSFVEKVTFIPVATTPTTMAGPHTLRVFISSVGAGATTSANTYLVAEVTAPAVAADSATVAVYPIDVPINQRIPAGWFVLVTEHTAPAANSNWRANVWGGDY